MLENGEIKKVVLAFDSLRFLVFLVIVYLALQKVVRLVVAPLE